MKLLLLSNKKPNNTYDVLLGSHKLTPKTNYNITKLLQ